MKVLPRLRVRDAGTHGEVALRRMLLLLAVLWIVLAPAKAADQPPPNLLIINSYAPGYQWSDDEVSGALRVLKAAFPTIEPVIEHLDFKRFADPAREEWLLRDVAAKCAVMPPRLIITFDNAAFDFALKHRDTLGSTIPIIFGGLNRFTPEMIADHPGISGVSEESDYSGTFELIGRLRPQARNILVIGSLTGSSQETRRAFSAVASAYSDRYRFEHFETWTNEELFARVAALPDDWVGLILDVTRDATGRYNYNDSEFSRQLSSQTRVPLFLTARPPGDNDWSIHPWDGIGGGMVVADVHGAKVGELAVRVLRGEDIRSIPVVRHSPQRLEVDYRQMARFGLGLNLLPPGTQVINQPETFYRINRSRIVLTGAVVLLLLATVAILSLNIIRRRRAEHALRRTQEQLHSAQKLEAVGLLAGGVAHDFNNLLTVIQGHSTFLQDSVGQFPQAMEDVKVIQQAVDRASQLTRQLLTIGRKQPLKPDAVEANAMIADMVKMLRRVLGEHIEVQVVPLPHPCTVIAGKGQLEQVLLNLSVNARDAMPLGGRLKIELSQIQLTQADLPSFPELKPGPYLVLTVSDTGHGMDQATLRRVFEPFFTTKEPDKGTGLGLSIVYGIVRQHQGAIRAYSESGKGTSFKILLPINATQLIESVLPPAGAFPRGVGAVLLAEDDPHVREIGSRILAHAGFRVLTASNGIDAEALVAAHCDELRIAIVDVLMPKRNGRQFAEIARQRFPTLPVLFCSGYSADMLPTEVMPGPEYPMITKPYTAEELLTQVHRLIHVGVKRQPGPASDSVASG
jgi:signal transduction histidine kinase/CheY-like chemotaxis protein